MDNASDEVGRIKEELKNVTKNYQDANDHLEERQNALGKVSEDHLHLESQVSTLSAES